MLTISINNKKYQISYDDIYYIESSSRKLIVHLKEKDYSYYQRLDLLETTLPTNMFIRIHKSYLVALSYISSYTNYKVLLKNGIELPISSSYRDSFKKFMKYASSISSMQIDQMHLVPEEDTNSNTLSSVTGALMCIRGIYIDSIIKIYPNKPILIGRDECCDIIYDIPLISRRHCTVIFRPETNKYELLDHSTNGTYIATPPIDKNNVVQSSPIPSGVPTNVCAGSIIHFGDVDNLFRLV